jgi:2,4-dienoyl-CoA reductase-like NADH-dependent reductase (Old Yellow Enzyme family)
VKLDGKCFSTREGPVDNVTPKEMTIQDIKDTISDYVHAAKCAISAGFDGVEIVTNLLPFTPPLL